MGRTQALTCMALLLVLVAKHEVQAETPCARQCPGLCEKKGEAAFQCYLYCVKHCNSKNDGMKLTKEEEEQLKSDDEAMLSEIEEELIKTPQDKLEEHDADKFKEFLGKEPEELKGQGSKKKVQGGKKNVKGSRKGYVPMTEAHTKPVIYDSLKN